MAGVGNRLATVHGPRSRVSWPIVVAVAVSLIAQACTSGDDPPQREAEPAGIATPDDVTPVLGPAPIDCAEWRYDGIEPAPISSEIDPDDYRLASRRSDGLATSRHHHCGQVGPAVDLAWGITTGSPEVVIAITDSGIRWRDRLAMEDLAASAYLNRDELPLPEGSERYDTNGDGAFNIADYALDPNLTDLNGNGMPDPEDLLLSPYFADGVDDDANGFIDDISGWDFQDDDNNPNDDVDNGHGTGQALDAVAPMNGVTDVGFCPRCQFLPLRVADSFLADASKFAAGVLFAVESRASIVQSALGAINNPSVTQRAIDVAVAAGIPVITSMADEQSEHPNLPSQLANTISVNSVMDTSESLLPLSESYLAVNGCTNTGGYIWVSVPSNSCSSEATGRAAGIVGLILSEARRQEIPHHPSLDSELAREVGNRLAPAEVAQLLALTADDIDFATPTEAGPATDPEPANDIEAGPGSVRFPTTPGWDATSGFGRINAFESVRSVANRSIPPDLTIEAPRFLHLADTTGTLEVTGRVAAPRSEHFDYVVEWAVGNQSPPHPADDDWTVVAEGSDERAALEGRLAEIDLADVAAEIPGDGSGLPVGADGAPDPHRFMARVRVTVTDAEGRVATEQRQFFVHHDDDTIDGFPTSGFAVGMSSPVAADLDGDGAEELIVPTDDGFIYVLRPDMTALDGFPVRTTAAPYWHRQSPVIEDNNLSAQLVPVGLGAPLVVDVDGDDDNELIATDLSGQVHIWGPTGALEWTAGIDPALSAEVDEFNRLKPAIFSQPEVGDLDGDGDLEVVAVAADRHVYAWHCCDDPVRPVAGFPVVVVDPSRVESVDPVSGFVEFADPSVGPGGDSFAQPAVGDLDGDGNDEIVVTAIEQYDGVPNVAPGFRVPGSGGNGRLYAIEPEAADVDCPGCAHPDAGAYLEGFPVEIAMLQTEILPTIGDGIPTSPRIGRFGLDGEAGIVVTSAAGPIYVIDRFGSSLVGEIDGVPSALPWTDLAGFAALPSALGAAGLVDLTGDGTDDIVAPVVNDRRVIDQVIPESQDGSATLLMAWDGVELQPLDGFPVATADLALLSAPSDLGDATAAVGNGVFTLDRVGADGSQPSGWPKLTGGWTLASATRWSADGEDRIVAARRDGVLLAWRDLP